MKRAISIFAVLILAINARAQFAFTNEVDGTFDASSYDTPTYKLWGDYFATYFYDMNPQFTNHIYSVSRSGASWENQFESQQQKFCLPLWTAAVGTNYDWMLANDNSSYLSNDVNHWGTNLFNAPPLFWDGTSITNEGVTAPVGHFSLGGIPQDSSTGDGGAISRNDGATNLAGIYHTPIVDMWHLLWTNGLSTDVTNARLFGFYTGGHPFPAGHLCMALKALIALGAETNIGSITLNWQAATATTNHCTASGFSLTGSVLSGTVHFDRMPPAWDIGANGSTNDARNAFVLMPDLGRAFQWVIQVTNLPAGTYTLAVDGTTVDTATDTQLAGGRNWFTNYNGPLWAQRSAVLDAKRDQGGVDRLTLLNHTAGSQGTLGVADLVNYQSEGALFYDTDGQRGTNYLNSMATFVSQLRQYDTAIHNAAVQTNHTLTITLNTTRYAPFHR
jgi:hypothetical protein